MAARLGCFNTLKLDYHSPHINDSGIKAAININILNDQPSFKPMYTVTRLVSFCKKLPYLYHIFPALSITTIHILCLSLL